MAVKKPKPVPSAKERQVADRVQRARKADRRFDRHGCYLDACGELASETGADPESIYSEFLHACACAMYEGEIEVEDAEMAALRLVQSVFRRAS